MDVDRFIGIAVVVAVLLSVVGLYLASSVPPDERDRELRSTFRSLSRARRSKRSAGSRSLFDPDHPEAITKWRSMQRRNRRKQR
jgi:hypothetical protein